MGVGGLQAFMEQYCPDSIRKVSLAQMTKTFQEQNPSIEEPIIVIDGLNCMFKLYDGLDWLCSGQWLEYIKNLENFVQSLHNLGLKPVFFFDGATLISKRDEWYKRRKIYLEETLQIFSLLKAKVNVPDSLFQLPASLGTLIRFALKHVCKVPIYTVINGDCDQTVATFAKRNNCVAVLTQDSDYIIYNTVPFISIKKLDLNTMETVVYDRDIFCACMNITLAQLPLLACLMGNDYVPRDSLKSFHSQIVRKYAAETRPQQHSSYNIKILASNLQFIKALRLEADVRDLDNRLPTVCKSVFGTILRLEDFRNGLAMYKLNDSCCELYRNPYEPLPLADHDVSTPEGIFDYILEKSIHNDLSETLYNSMIIGTCEVGPALEDQKNPSFAPSELVYRPIRSRLFDLIFAFRDKYIKERVTLTRIGVSPSNRDYIDEWWVNPKNPQSKPEQVHRSPVRVHGERPDLLKLWTDGGPSTEQLKWETIQACFNLSQSTECLKRIPDKFKLLCMMLNYLIQSTNVPLESWEVDAILVQCVLPNAFVIGWIQNLNVKPYDHHAIHLAALFYRGITQFHTALTICGEPFPIEKSMPWHFFDGKRFHHCYKALKSGTSVEDLCSNNRISLDQFELLKKSTYENLNE